MPTLHAPWLVWIPLAPVLAFALNITIGRRWLRRAASVVAIGAMVISSALALNAFRLAGHHLLSARVTWLLTESQPFTVGFQVDGLTAVMLLVVTLIGTLIQLYSIGYMHDDPRFSRFFAYLSLFCGSMLGLVLADNFALLFVFWELVGLCSYLLISFWFEKPAAAAAGRKAFITTRIGDTGLLVALLILFWYSGSLDFAHLTTVAHRPEGLWTVAAILIFCGAVGKSAQFPLHVWLPDAMEGPTPVSALIHAATMVAAGVYLVARSYPIFAGHPFSLDVVAVIGTITAFFAATIACAQTDIKRVLAYSTISQLGYMMVGLGVGGQAAGMFHLMTHACFKALLFLGAGSVIHAAHTQEMHELGGLWKQMPVTAWTCLIGTLAIAGLPPLSGFFSKDEILLAALEHRPIIFAVMLATSGLTAFYMFRFFLRTFWGRPSHHAEHAHESPWVMTLPLTLLALASISVGWTGSPWMHHAFQTFLAGGHAASEPAGWNPIVVGGSLAAAAFGIALAWARYARGWVPFPLVAPSLRRRVHAVVANKYRVDEAYDRWLIQPCLRLTQRLAAFDLQRIDGFVNWTGVTTVALSWWHNLVDQRAVDGAVNGVAEAAQAGGRLLRRIQSGFVQQYLWIVVCAVTVLALSKLW